jgi:DNA mismatch endonuclease (patch repair protein)
MFDWPTRSRIMKTVRRVRTEPEERLAGALRAAGLRFRRNDSTLSGSPDFVLRKYRIVIFVDGDFWHGRTWFSDGAAPGTNREFWIRKFEVNRKHDLKVGRRLRAEGWIVRRFWGSDARREPERLARRVIRLVARLTSPILVPRRGRELARRDQRPSDNSTEKARERARKGVPDLGGDALDARATKSIVKRKRLKRGGFSSSDRAGTARVSEATL